MYPTKQVYLSLSPEDGNRSTFLIFVFPSYPEFQTMDKVHRLSNSEWYTPPSEQFIFYTITNLWDFFISTFIIDVLLPNAWFDAFSNSCPVQQENKNLSAVVAPGKEMRFDWYCLLFNRAHKPQYCTFYITRARVLRSSGYSSFHFLFRRGTLTALPRKSE